MQHPYQRLDVFIILVPQAIHFTVQEDKPSMDEFIR